jgi:hypothetical protein
MVMSTGARRRRRIRAIRRAQVNPVKPLPTITIEVTNPSVGRVLGCVVLVQCTVANIAQGLAWSMMPRQDQFRSALASRDINVMAKEVVIKRFNLDAVEAFDLLARLSEQSNIKPIDSEHLLKPHTTDRSVNEANKRAR